MIKNRGIENRVELVYKALYFVFTLISFNSFLARKSFISYVSYVLVIIGAFIIINRMTHIKDYLNIRIWLLFAFVISYIFSAINTIRYGYVENLQAIAWMAIQFFIVFAYDCAREKEQVKNDFNIVATIFIVYTMIMAVVAIIMMIKGYSKNEIIDEYYYVYSGFLFNRLWGAYVDPNYGAVLSLISILFSCYYFKKANILIRILLTINIILEYLYISYSDSRTGELAILMSFAVLIFELLIRKKIMPYETSKLKKILKIVLIIIVSVFSACLIWYGTHAVQNITSDIKVKMAKEVAVEQGATAEQIQVVESFERIGREVVEIHGGDISNNRFDIWKYGLKAFKQNPILGISFRNIMEYSLAEMPEEYVGFESMHNAFVDVLVSQGLVGFVVLVALMLIVIIQVLKKANQLSDSDYILFSYSFSCVFAIIASMLTYSETFYMNTGGAFLFWYLLGLITNYLLIDKKVLEN